MKIFDIEILRKRGLVTNEELNDNYYKVYYKYKELLEKYLSKKLNLQEYDSEFEKSSLQFAPVDLDENRSSIGLKYLYLKNDICVEKIPEEIISQLLTGEIGEDIIESTYKNVIDNNMRSDLVVMNCYGDDYWYDSKDLIIGFKYDQFYENGLPDDEWMDNNNKQSLMINKILNEIKEKGFKELGINVQALWFDPEVKEKVL